MVDAIIIATGEVDDMDEELGGICPECGKDPCCCESEDDKDEFDESEFLDKALKRFRECQDGERQNREDALDDLRFVNGEQWPEELRMARVADGRPCLTINRLPAFIDQVVGDQRQNRPAIKIRAVDDVADPTMARVLEGLIRNIEYVSNAEAAYDVAFENAVTCGFGYFRVLTDYSSENGFDQDILIKPIRNPFTVGFDLDCNEQDYSDARYAFVSELLPLEVFEERYEEDADAPTSIDSSPGDGDWRQQLNGEEHVRVAEYWYKETVTRTLVMLTDGRTMYEEDLPADAEIATRPDGTPHTRVFDTHRVMWAKISATKVLEGPSEWPGKYIPIVPVLGKEINIEGRRTLRGLIRFAKDPQRMYNYWRTAMAERMALSPKAPFLVTPEQIEGFEDMWAQANVKNQPYLLYHDIDNVNLPQRVDFPPVPTGESQEAQVSVDEMKATTGIFDASLGAQGNETSGRAILARQKEGDTATFAFMDNLSRGIRFAGKIIIDLIPKIYDTERAVRILGPDGAEELVKLNEVAPDGRILRDVSIGQYDVVVSTGPSYNTQRQEAVASMMELFQAQPALFQLIGDLWMDSMDWPQAEEIAARLKRMLPPQLMDLKTKMSMMQQQMQEQQAEQQMQQQMGGQPQGQQAQPDPAAIAKMAELELKKAELKLQKEKAMAEMQLKQQELQLEVQKVMGELEIRRRELEIKAADVQNKNEHEAVKQTRANIDSASKRQLDEARFATDNIHKVMDRGRAHEQDQHKQRLDTFDRGHKIEQQRHQKQLDMLNVGQQRQPSQDGPPSVPGGPNIGSGNPEAIGGEQPEVTT